MGYCNNKFLFEQLEVLACLFPSSYEYGNPYFTLLRRKHRPGLSFFICHTTLDFIF